MQVKAKIVSEDWELPLTLEETRALLENFAAVTLCLRAFEMIAVVFGDAFTIEIADVIVERWDALSGPVWAALDPVRRWASCQCQSWRDERSCDHVDALRRRAEPATEPVAVVLMFPTGRRS